MPYDITMCMGGDCPLKTTCYRYTSKALGRQDYFGRIPFNFAKQACDQYWSIQPSHEQISQLAYKLWLEKGCPEGSSLENWFEAEKILLQRAKL